MPEGPEAYITSAFINGLCCGKTIVNIQWDTYVKQEDLCYVAYPTIVNVVHSWGKKVVMRLNNGQIIMTSLGMDGVWTTEHTGRASVTITFGTPMDGMYIEDFSIYFSQKRPLGHVYGITTPDQLKHRFKDVGTCIVNSPLTFESWLPLITKRPNELICTELLEQKRIAGVGNYLRADILWYAQIDPRTLVGQLTMTMLWRLHEATYRVVHKSVRDQGYSIRDWKKPDSSGGDYQSVVYGKLNGEDPLGNPVEFFEDKPDRKIWWVPAVQKYYDTESLNLLNRFCV